MRKPRRGRIQEDPGFLALLALLHPPIARSTPTTPPISWDSGSWSHRSQSGYPLLPHLHRARLRTLQQVRNRVGTQPSACLPMHHWIWFLSGMTGPCLASPFPFSVSGDRTQGFCAFQANNLPAPWWPDVSFLSPGTTLTLLPPPPSLPPQPPPPDIQSA